MAAGNAVVGALRVVLGADTAILEKGLKNAQSRLSAFSGHVKIAGAVIAGALAGVVGGVAAGVKQTIDEADKLGKMSQSIGVPVEELSKLKHAADLSGVSLDTLSKGVGRLNRNIVEGAQGLSTPIRAFEALGISIRNTDGSLKTVSQALPEIADRFSRMRDGPEKTALAMQLLGRAGAELIPLLNGGRAGLEEMMREAEALGIVIDTKTAKAAEAFNDNLTRLARVKDGIITQITARMVPALQQLSQVMIDAAKNSSLMQSAADGITAVLKGAINAGIATVTVFQRLGAELSAFWKMVSAPNWEEMKAGYRAWQSEGTQTAITLGALNENIRKFWADAEANAAKAPALAENSFRPLIQNAAEVEKAAKEAERALKRIWAAGKRTFEETRTPQEEFALRMQKINEQYNAGAFGADTYARAVAQAQDRLVSATPAAQMLESALMSTFDRAIDGGMKFGDILKSLALDLAKMAASSAFRALLMGNAGMGGTFAGIIGSIFGAGIPGFAKGGSFTVGGTGGIDSQLAMMRVTPGERVTVSKKGEGGPGGGQTFIDQSVNNFNSQISGTDRQWVQSVVDQRVAASESRTRQWVSQINQRRAG